MRGPAVRLAIRDLSTTLQAVEEMVSFAIYEFNFPSLGSAPCVSKFICDEVNDKR